MASLAGSFLVARATLKDPNFSQTVVLLLAHSDEGAYGVVVNRPFAVKGLPFPLYEGGPCQAPGLVLLHGHPDWSKAAVDPEKIPEEVAPGVFVGDAACLKKAAAEGPEGPALRVRVFRGFAGWGPGQLEGELSAGAWALTAASGQLLFDTPAEDLWNHLSPPAVPQFSLN